VSGSVFLDANQNGFRDSCDRPLRGAPLRLSSLDAERVKDGGFRTQSNEDGSFQFASIPGGEYRADLRSETNSTYLITTPLDNLIEFSLEQGESADDLEFGLADAAPVAGLDVGYLVTGVVFEDADGDGEADAGECGIPEASVRSQDGAQATSVVGRYRFHGSGRIDAEVVAELPRDFPDFWVASGEDGSACAAWTVSAEAADAITGANIGFRPLSATVIEGLVFNDLDKDGIRDPGEHGSSGWQLVFAPRDAESCESGDYKLAQSDASGYYRIEVAPGEWVWRWEVSAFPGLLTALTSEQLVEVVVEEAETVGVDIGYDYSILSWVEVYAFEDLNEDGQRQKDEPPAEGLNVCGSSGNPHDPTCLATAADGIARFGPFVASTMPTISIGAVFGRSRWEPSSSPTSYASVELTGGVTKTLEFAVERAE